MQIAITLYLFLLLIISPYQNSTVGGLKFHGSEKTIANRTSYDVFGEQNVIFSDHFFIDFQIAFHPATPIGYILRIKNEESDRIFNLFYDGQGSNLKFNFNVEGNSNLIAAELDKDRLPGMHWFNMRIDFNLKSDSLILSIGDRSFSISDVGLPKTYKPVLLFGKSDHIIDVPSFAIKELTVGNGLVYSFPLKEHEGSTVYGTDGLAVGKVENPEWLINDAYQWKHEATFHSETVAGANYNPVRKEFYYYNRDSMHIHNIISEESSVIKFNEICPVNLVLGTNFLDLKGEKLYTYEVYYETGDYEPTVASLDLDTFKWNLESFSQLPTQLHHHGGYYNSETGDYTIFGGFGNMQYSRNFYTYKTDDKEWVNFEGFTGDVISPRYFSSVGYLKEKNAVYIFGGMGNESGEQIVGRKYYYDLYKVDLNTKSVTQLWDIPWNHDNMVPVRGMVILNDSSFYTLCYPEHFTESHLKLYRFSLADGSYEILGDSIPIYSDKINTNANLYFDSSLNKLFATVQEFDDDISSNLKIYSLDFPPITTSELNSYISNAKTKRVNHFVILLLGVSIAIGAFLLYKRRKNRSSANQSDTYNLPNESEVKNPEVRSNSIYLFGEFAVYDRNGKDITYMFSAKLKQVLCLVLQYSTEEGISSKHLSETLWSEKSSAKIKNIRGVTINNLRKALKELDGVELVYDRGYFKITHTTPFYCDYLRGIEICAVSDHLDRYRLELLEIIMRGKFLSAADHPLYDNFKESVEQTLEPVLVVEMEKCYLEKSYQEVINFAEAIFNIDPLNDAALKFQVKALQKLNRDKEAKIRYQTFLIDYKQIMGNDYPNPIDL